MSINKIKGCVKMIDLKQVRGIVNEHVKLMVGEIEEKEPRITFAVRDKGILKDEKEAWRLTIKYTPKTKEGPFKWERDAIFKIDAETGNVMDFKQGHSWRF
jgi:hypothetical protein